MPERASDKHPFLVGGGEMGSLMRGHDWSRSPLGPPETWAAPLRMGVSLMLNSAFPMFVAWGPGLGFLYNDAYVEILGAKHPEALGRPFQAIWSEIWSEIVPLVEKAMGGGATFMEDMPLRMVRHGHQEDTCFTFSYSPMRDEAGGVAGMLCVCRETTGEARERRRNEFLLALGDALRAPDDPETLIATACGMLGRHLAAQRCGFGEADATGIHYTVTRDWTDGTMPSLVGIHRMADFGEDVVNELRAGRSLRLDDVTTDPRTVASADAYENVGTVRAVLSVPLVMEGRLWASVFVNQSAPRHWTDDEEALVRDVAGRIFTALQRSRAERALAAGAGQLKAALEAAQASQARLSMAVGIARLGTFEWDTGTGAVEMDGQSREIFDLPAEGPVHQDEVFLRLAKIDVERARTLTEAAVVDGARVQADYRVTRADGTSRTILSASEPLTNEAGHVRMIGVFHDVTDLRQAEADLRETN